MPSANDIANQVRVGLQARGVTLSPTVGAELPAMIQVIIALSAPLRNAVRSFLTTQLVQLQLLQSHTLFQLRQYDTVSQEINTAMGTINTTLAPVDRLLAAMPVDSAVGMSPTLSTFLREIADSMPIRLPASIFTGSPVLDIFDGIQSYADLRKKGNDLLYEASLITSASRYAQTANVVLNEQSNKAIAYIYIIETLTGSARDVLMLTPTAITIASPVGIADYGSVTLTNVAYSSIGGYYTLAGDSSFSLPNATTNFAIVNNGDGVTITIKFLPLIAETVTGTLTIIHDATNMSSPIVITLTGRGF